MVKKKPSKHSGQSASRNDTFFCHWPIYLYNNYVLKHEWNVLDELLHFADMQ